MHEADDDRATIAQTTSTWPVENAERAGESAGYGHMPASEDHMVGSFGEAPAPERPRPRLAAARLKRFQLRRFGLDRRFGLADVVFLLKKLMLYL